MKTESRREESFTMRRAFFELSIIDQKSETMKFYQQIPMEDDLNLMAALQAFYEFLYCPQGGGGNDRLNRLIEERKKSEGVSELPVIDRSSVKMPRILISCSSGASSSLYAHRLKSSMKDMGVEITVDAVSFLEMDRVQADYDIILLAPQVAYKQKEYRQLYGDKVWTIQTMDYATVNVKPIEEKLLGKA